MMRDLLASTSQLIDLGNMDALFPISNNFADDQVMSHYLLSWYFRLL